MRSRNECRPAEFARPPVRSWRKAVAVSTRKQCGVTSSDEIQDPKGRAFGFLPWISDQLNRAKPPPSACAYAVASACRGNFVAPSVVRALPTHRVGKGTGAGGGKGEAGDRGRTGDVQLGKLAFYH